MPVDYLPTPVPPIDSSSPSRGEGEEEATICVCLACGSKESCFLIKSGSALPPPDSSPSWDSVTISRPDFTVETRYGCAVVAVGSIIYVIGGDRRGQRGGSAEDFWLDTLDASEEWKIGPPMASKRSDGCSAFSVDGKIYVMGGNSVPPFAEVLNTNNKGDRWTGIWANSIILQALPVVICSPGVFNKKVFAHAPHSSDLYCYDTVTDTWSVFDDSFGCHKRDSALVDGVPYYLDFTVPGELFGLDVSAPGPRFRKKKRVKIDGWGFPRADPFAFEPVHPMLYLVSMGRVKLAVFWLTLSRIPHRVIHVNCSIFKMSKTLNEKGDIKSLNANFDSYICLHAESCGMIRHCLPLTHLPIPYPDPDRCVQGVFVAFDR